MSIEQMRKALMSLYGPSWPAKVEKMSDKQVYSVYMRCLNRGMFKKEKK